MGGWTGTFMATFLVHTQVGTSSILAIALINVWRRRGRRKLLFQQFVEKNVFQVLSFHRVFLLCVFHRHTHVKMAHIPDTILLQVCVYECVRPHWPLQRRPSLWSVYPLGQMQWWEPGRLTHCHSHPPSRHSFTSVCGHKQEAQTFDVSWRNLFFFFLPTYTLLPESSCSWILRCCRLLLPVPRWTLGDAAVSVSG